MDRFTFWRKWLLVVSVLLAIFGLAMAVLSGTLLFDIFDDQVNSVFWGDAPPGDNVELFQQWIYGVLGATVAGWGIFLAFLTQNAFAKKERWAWLCMAVGLGVWFIVDTVISLYLRVYFNAFFNTVLFVIAGLPVMATWRHFWRSTID